MPASHSASRPFTLDVPYQIVLPHRYEDGKRYPLIVALHGMAQDEAFMREKLAPLFERGYIWLLPRGPYPLEVRGRQMRVGYAWYMYDGDQARLRKSMELSARHLLGIIDGAWNSHRIDLSRAAVIGFSQGGYMAGVLGGWNSMRFKAVVCISGRIKYEFLEETAAKAGKRLAIAQVHGAKDTAVKAEAAKEAIEACKKQGFTCADYFEDPDAGHEITPKMVEWIGQWLEKTL